LSYSKCGKTVVKLETLPQCSLFAQAIWMLVALTKRVHERVNNISYTSLEWFMSYTYQPNILWHVDPLLSSDSVNNDHFCATAR
jgi:hypothetical protein